MINYLRRALRFGFKPSTRSYDGAAGGRRFRRVGEMPSPLSSGLAARGSLASRARYLVANNGYAAAGAKAWVSAVAGAGITPQSACAAPDLRKIVMAAWSRFVDECDADGQSDLYGLQAVLAERMVVDGEAFVVLSHDEIGRLRLRLMAADQIDGAYTAELGNGAHVVAGVELDTAGRRVAYHALKERPGLQLLTSLERVRLPAESVCHIHRVEHPGQVRGTTWFASVLLRLADLDSAQDAQLVRQKIAALLTGFVTETTSDTVFDGAALDRSTVESSLEPGTVKVLQPGQDIKFSPAAPIGLEAIEFLKITAREIAAGLGIPYEQLTGDLSGVNYSSIRAGLVEFRRRVEALQFSTLIFQFCRPVWRQWLTTEILSGRIDAPQFSQDPEAILAVNWLPPRSAWVDPLKDVEAEILAINAGLMSRRQAVAARGYDLEALDIEIAADTKDAAALGLHFFASANPESLNKKATP